MLAGLCVEDESEILVATPGRERKELITLPDLTEPETESDFEDTAELPFNSCTVTKLHKTSRSRSKHRVVRIDAKPIVGGLLPTVMKECNTYTMPSYYYSLPKYEWKQFYFLQPIKSSLKPIINPLATNRNPSSVKQQRIVHLSQPSAERLRLHPIGKLSRSLSKPLREPPTWPEIIGAQFPIDPPMSRLMFTRSPTKLLMPLAIATPPKLLSSTEAPTSLEYLQAKHAEKCKPKLQVPKSCIKMTKGRPMEIGGPMKVSSYCIAGKLGGRKVWIHV